MELHDFVVMPNTFWSQVTDEDRKQLLRCVLELKDKARVVVTHGTETWVRPSGRFSFLLVPWIRSASPSGEC